MRILFDQGVPRGLAACLRGHEVTEARQLRWERISNGALLKLCRRCWLQSVADDRQEPALSAKPSRAQNLYVVLGQSPWWLVRQHLDAIVAAVNAAKPGSYAEVQIPFP